MNPHLSRLQSYPFEKLRRLFSGITPASLQHINLGIGEPRHPTPQLIKNALSQHLDGLANYPATKGIDELRQAIAGWLKRRYHIPLPDSQTQIIPTLGSREALFSLAQAVLDPLNHSLVICPNPFYQIYEGAALLGGAEPYFVNANPACRFNCDYDSVPAAVWEKARLLYLCSPANPTGSVLDLSEWKKLFELSDQYGFIIASDECYSEIYFDNNAPLGGLQAASLLGRSDYRNLVILSSLSKRSNVPGMRSGFAAGDAAIIEKFLLYRTYHGSAMNLAIQHASIAAWNDETHVIENRRKYQEKFRAATPLLQEVLNIDWPDASFYLWAEVHEKTGLTDTEFARRLYENSNVTVLPGSYLARQAHGINPGENRIRIALVAEYEELMEAVSRITGFIRRL
ncbi:MAG: succinyldiaminopimelate transaminase [Alistipes senegalensis]|nr:succinyldiaminopimelate transaminase [Oxalobacter formigenes]MCM1281296.1 succinyldiaminopimelate transaminase [Alistipes senegalensis]